MHVIWTTEQVAGLAPTNHLLKTSRSFMFTEKWLTLGQNGEAAWGIFQLNKEKPPIQTSLMPADLYFSCSCASRSFPCAHGLGLLQLMIDDPTQFTRSATPDWVMTWQQDVQNRINLQRQRDTAVPPPHHIQKRLTTIQVGLAELELWLHDLIRNGLAAARHKPKDYWFRMADRLVDAQASGVAAELRSLAAIPSDDVQWAEIVLRRIGRLYLLIQGFQHFDTLPADMQADLQTAVGWLPRGAASESESSLYDRWHILGQEMKQSGGRQVQHIWLWGEQNNRAAQISHTTHGQRYKDFSLLTGTVIEARLQFYASAAPVHAQIIERYNYYRPDKPVAGYASIEAATAAFNQALAANPWLKQFPMMLMAVPVYDGTRWLVRDEAGTNLLLPTHYKHGWHLLAMWGARPLREAECRPLPIFGLFDGRFLTPLSAWNDGRYLPLHILRGVV